MRIVSILALIGVVAVVGALSFASRGVDPAEEAQAESNLGESPSTGSGAAFQQVTVCDGVAVTCDDLPKPLGAECHCPWTATTTECKCSNGRRGLIYEINCSVCGQGCCGPGCGANCDVAPACWEPSFQVCVEGLL